MKLQIIGITESETIPMEGSPYILTCMVSGLQSLTNASENYQWSRDSNTLRGATDSKYNFTSIDRSANGTYTCEVIISSPTLSDDIMLEDSTTIQVTGKYFFCNLKTQIGSYWLFVQSQYQHIQL